MTKRMLIDATHPEETRVAVVSGTKLEEYDYETVVRKQLKGNIYLVKVTRVEPSLQAAFVDFGGNRHGFLPFPEIHPDYYRIPIADREALLAEERAIAAAQAAREDEEDEAELAAQGHSLDDFDDEEDDSEEGDDAETANAGNVSLAEETYVPRHTGSLAADMAEESQATEENEEDDAAEEQARHDEQQAQVADTAEAHTHSHDHSHAGEGETAVAVTADSAAPASDEEKDPDVETVGGDVVETPVYRSSIKRRYKIQEVIKRNQIMLIQISKEERGNKGAAVTSYISLPGRYCVLMPNSPRGGGVSRKVSNAKDRQRLKKILQELNVPEGMSVILRTAGVARSKAEIKRDLDYLLRLWDQIREYTLKSSAPALIYEEGNLIKRAIRDLYRRDIDEVHVAGEVAYTSARDFMQTLMPSHAERIQHYKEENIPLFFRYQVESQIDEIHNPTVHLKSGGYIVINPTEAMVSVDVNSGKATKGRHIEETALKTNIEAADEIARQLRLRDQGGLIVIDFIDMEDKRNNRIVERRMRDAMQTDRASIQLGRISAFGLLELSRQRLHPSLVETNFEVCKHCTGSGLVRTIETTAVIILRAIEEEGLRNRASEITVNMPGEVALYIFNHKREMLANIERRYNLRVSLHADESLLKPAYNIEVTKTTGQQARDNRPQRPQHVQTVDMSDLPALTEEDITDHSTVSEDEGGGNASFGDDDDNGGGNVREAREGGGGRNRGGRHGGGRRDGRHGGRSGGDGDRHGGRHEGRGDRNEPRGDRNEGRHGGGRDHTPRHAAPQQQHASPEDVANIGGDMPAIEGGASPANAAEGDDSRGQRRRGRRGGRRRGGRRGDRPFDRNAPEGAVEGQPQEFNESGDNSQPATEGNEAATPQNAEGHAGGGGGDRNRDRNRGGRNRGGRDRNRGPRENNNGGRHQSADGQLPGTGEQPGYERPATEQPAFKPREQAPQPRREEQSNNSTDTANDGNAEGGDGKSRKGWWKRLTE